MRLVLAMLLVALLAGCSDGGAPAAVAVQAAVGDLPGVVVDATIQPIAGARIVAMPGGRETTTDSGGQFILAGLEPGSYTLTATADGFLPATLVATVLADRPTAVAKLVLDRDLDAVAYALAYKFDGFFECGLWPEECSNVNIVTWIVLCSYGVCLGNVSSDRSLFLQWIDGLPDFLQTELVWQSTQPLGDQLAFGIGGATEEQLSTGMATTYNHTHGTSPLMLTIQGEQLVESQIGVDRALLTQVLAGRAADVPADCPVYGTCGPGIQLMQQFQTFTHAFYGFTPAPGWRFSADGPPIPPA